MNVLIVDDNPENIELVKDILDMAGYQAITADNGQAALQLVEDTHPDLILLDVNMPHISGFEVCEQLKSQPETRDIPVIMLTAQSDVDSRVKGLAAGADDYLTKPFSPRELMARVQRSLRSKAVSDEMRVRQEQIRRTFERFVAAPVVEQLLKDPEQVKLGGRLQPVTILFADLGGFTSLSEHTEPENLLQLLNSYHTLLVDIILEYGGTIDKFLGDGVMALYNTPVQQDDHIARAVKSALHIQDKLHWFRQDLPEKHRLAVNFGIHSGDAVVGNVGTENLMDFTAVGDAVNVAARLQGVAKSGQILVTEPVYEATKDFIFGRSQGDIQVKGREKSVRTYELSNTYFE